MTWKPILTEKCPRFVKVMEEKMKSQAERAKSGNPVALKLFKGFTSENEDVTSLYSDTITSRNLFFQDHAYKFLHIQETIDVIEKIKEKRSDGRSSDPNIVIGILDSGLKVDHLAFRGRILASKNFVHDNLPASSTDEDEAMECQHDEGYDLTIDRHGHGTFCASIAAGDKFDFRAPDGTPNTRETTWRMGVAPFAKIIYGKVASSDGNTNPKFLTEAIKWLLEFPDDSDRKVDIISLSLGFQIFDAELRKVISEANSKGKIIICAASNDGRQQQTNIAFPARFGDVICVGSHSRNGQPSASSPTGREIDFLAPGEDIWGASSAHEDAVIAMSGTSVATPFVAGIAAIVIKAAHHIGGDPLRKKVSNTTVMREILRKMASMPGHHDEAMGYGNLDPYRVFRLLRYLCLLLLISALVLEADAWFRRRRRRTVSTGCSTPPTLSYTYRSGCYYPYTNGERCTYRCQTGYRQVSGSTIRTCSYGRWSGTNLVCRRICPTAPVVMYTIRSGCLAPYTQGETCYYRCLPGYTQISGSTAKTCSNGFWTGSSLVCRRGVSGCSRGPPYVTYTYRYGCSYPYTQGESCYYRCLSGYTQVSGSTVRTCSSGGWTGTNLVCRRAYGRK
uniref:Sushi domain-containing protein n=1 Tax=Branchiostoma floridae TaxID=7739 RepID=C3Y9P4_BRAFL|eukprot:XP_002607290.1 hypothetical protein BRAFLDRAFT_88239 [Branchiostoma floridae]